MNLEITHSLTLTLTCVLLARPIKEPVLLKLGSQCSLNQLIVSFQPCPPNERKKYLLAEAKKYLLAEAVVGFAGFEKNKKYFLIFEPTYSLISALPPRDMFFFSFSSQYISVGSCVYVCVCIYERDSECVYNKKCVCIHMQRCVCVCWCVCVCDCFL